VKNLFHGKLSHQLIGVQDPCSHQREREEEFYTISVDVRDKSDLYSGTI
jgi:hypothetical protein